MDVLSPVERSAQMSLVRSKDTKPEWTVRRIVHALGFRYRLHGTLLPGKPDLVFSLAPAWGSMPAYSNAEIAARVLADKAASEPEARR